MSKQLESLPGSKPRKLIRSQRPNNPSLASYSMKALFGQEKLDFLDSKFYEYRNSPVPLSKNINPQRKTQMEQPKHFISTELKQETHNRSINDPIYNNLSNIRSQSLPKAFPDLNYKDHYPQAIDFAQKQFDNKKEKSPLGMPPRNSLNQLLYKKGLETDNHSANQQRQDNVIKGLSIASQRNSGSEISKFNFLNHNSIKSKQNHGYNIINCYPGVYI